MVLCGLLARNVISLVDDLPLSWISVIRNIALATLLFRAGLNLDFSALKKLGGPTLRLAFLPQFTEGFVCCALSRILFELP